MARKIMIQYWSDYVCPFCYIGMRHMKSAIKELKLEEICSMEMRSFELDRYAPIVSVYSAAEHFSSKYGIVLEKAKEQVDLISEKGVQAGISDMDYGETHSTNTLDAHRLTKYAKGKGIDLQERIYHAFFCENRNIGKRDELLKIAVESDINAADVETVLTGKLFEKDVRADENEARSRGVRMVPFFLLSDGSQFSGSGSVKEMKQFLQNYFSNMEDEKTE